MYFNSWYSPNDKQDVSKIFWKSCVIKDTQRRHFLIDLDPVGLKMYKLGSFQFYLDIERCQTLKILKEPLTTLMFF